MDCHDLSATLRGRERELGRGKERERVRDRDREETFYGVGVIYNDNSNLVCLPHKKVEHLGHGLLSTSR